MYCLADTPYSECRKYENVLTQYTQETSANGNFNKNEHITLYRRIINVRTTGRNGEDL
jgi:hypothetical protein